MPTNIKKHELLADNTTLTKLYANINVLDSNACWNWTGTRVKDGYGKLTKYIDGKRYTIFTHRLSWTAHNGPIPDGMVVDHTCHTSDIDNCKGACQHRSCINPAHLRITTIAENLRIKRGNTKSFSNLGLMHPEDRGSCINGHPYFEGSYVTYKSGKRACKACVKVNNMNSMARAREKAGK
jgi:hypothetical protein